MTQHPTSTTPDTASGTAVRLRGLRRRYGSGAGAFEAVRGVDLDVATGSIHALLGVNGAGKTSTLELVEGLARPSGGEVRVLGLDPVADRSAVRRRTGTLLQHSGFVADLTVRETLQMWAATLSHPRPVDEALADLALTDRADTPMRGVSGGEQRRIDLACALLGRPEVLFLDEPTTGLDPESRRMVWDLVRGLQRDGVTILLTTHYLEEAEALADQLSIMSAGRIVREGTPEEIVAGHPSRITFRTPDRPLPDLTGTRARLQHDGRTSVLEVDDLQRGLTELLVAAEREGVRLEGLSARTASLESVFLEIADRAGGPPEETTGDPAPARTTVTDDRLEGSTR